ncbi:MAG TPA: fibronectin type III domain-containing protein, partial [Opitutales bacterium]|nr:fibronectin type III domain-containing protein [Opitutales bacterium]
MHAAFQDDIGLYDMRARDGTLTGAGVTVGQIEAQQNNSDNYQTDPANMGLDPSKFTYFDSTNTWSSGGASFNSFRESSHANTVGGRFFAVPGGTQGSDGVAPGVSSIEVFEAGHYYFDLAALGTATNASVVNQSFVFTGLTEAETDTVDSNYDDYAVNRSVLFVNGINTQVSPATIPSPGSSYNGIAVGAIDRAISPLPDNRSKPDIVAPGATASSFTTPLVAGAAAILIQSALREDAGSGTAAAASDIRTIKALILNSATKRKGWSNTSTQPLDRPNGAGVLEVNQAQLQLAAGQFSETVNNSSSGSPPGSGTNVAALTGWNLSDLTSSVSTSGNGPFRTYSYGAVTDHYYFDCNSSIANSFYLNSTLVWNRQSGRSSINNFELYLYQDNGTLIASSVSSVDNVEHLYQRHLPPGRYVLSVHRPAFSLQDSGDSTTETYALAFNFRPAPAPGTPGNLSATAVSTSQINLSWTDTSDDETGYRIERRPSGGSYSTITTLAANSTSYSDSSLASGTTYEYRVTAFNAEAESPATASATTDAALPAAPSGATATALSATAIDLAWTDNSDNEDGFRIERRPAGGSYADLVTLAANTTTYSDTGLTDGTLYEYRITAFNGSGSSSGATASDATLLASPTGAATTTISDTELQVSWTDNSASEDGYRIERRPSGGSYSVITTVAANTQFFDDNALAPATGYDYRITAFNTTGDSTAIETSGSTYSRIEDWRLTFFGTTANSGDAADGSDPDLDSIANVVEFTTGSDPTAFSPNPLDSSLLGT